MVSSFFGIILLLLAPLSFFTISFVTSYSLNSLNSLISVHNRRGRYQTCSSSSSSSSCSSSKYSISCRRKEEKSVVLYGQLFESIVPKEEKEKYKNQKQRLDVFLATAFPNHSRSFLSDLCEKGGVKVNNKVINSKSFRLTGGDSIVIDVEEKAALTAVVPENIPLDVIYEDEHMIVINKPQGMVVHPAPGSPNGTFVNALLYRLGPNAAASLFSAIDITKSKSSNVEEEEEEEDDAETVDLDLDLPETPEAAKASPASLRPGIVHRLDKGTTGVLLAGKHPEAVTKLSALFAQRQIRKVYLTVAIGHPGETTIVEPIGRSQKNRQLMTVYDGPPGKTAITHVRTLAFDGKLSAALVRIETGRTHQIRVHLKERRTPIAGDDAYGNFDWNKKLSRSDNIHRPLLHAYETELIHPFTGKQLILRAPVPADMANLLKKLAPVGEPLLDNDTMLLKGSTIVKGKEFGEGKSEGTGYVPYDRLSFEEEHFTSWDLPEEQMF